MNTIDKRRESAEKRAVRIRNYQRARGRALVRLAQQYPDQYKELLEQERLADEAQDKTWLDITGRTRSSMGEPASHPTGKATQRPGGSGEKSNVGGEG
jgi:hypothetical protein